MAHVPVLTAELIELLDPEPDSRVIDCTFGAGGHATAVTRRLGPQGFFIGCDRDPIAHRYFEELRSGLRVPARFYPGDFAESLSQMVRAGLRATHIYMDLGVSSMQIDTVERGFSYSYDAPLDMRMDPAGSLTAAEILNSWDEGRLSRIFMRIRRGALRPPHRPGRRSSTRQIPVLAHVGVGRHHQRRPSRLRPGSDRGIRRGACSRLCASPSTTSLRASAAHCRRRSRCLEPGGVLAVISFHSLEDRIVKEFFVAQAHPCTCPPDFPLCVCGRRAHDGDHDHQAGHSRPAGARTQPSLQLRQAAGGSEAVMASAARSWQHPRWQHDEDGSEAARRSAARMASRERTHSRGARLRSAVSVPGRGRTRRLLA